LYCLPADDLSSYVQLHKSPSDPVFYEVNYHCYGIVPALSNPAYYTSKLTSAVITSLMTGAAQRQITGRLRNRGTCSDAGA
jgi:hypothetical protein